MPQNCSRGGKSCQMNNVLNFRGTFPTPLLNKVMLYIPVIPITYTINIKLCYLFLHFCFTLNKISEFYGK